MNNLIIERIVVGDLETNCYILADQTTKQGFIIDPGGEQGKIKKAVKKLSVDAVGVINTHGHFDHIRADDAFDLPVYIHHEDAPALTDPSRNFSSIFPPAYSYRGKVIVMRDGDTVKMGTQTLKIIHTPGHSPGGICILVNMVLLSGDTLFYHSIGRTDIGYADQRSLISSIQKKLFLLPPATEVFPGHGMPTSIREELAENPFTHG